MATYGFKEGKNKSDVYTKAEVDGLVDGIAGEVEAAITPTLDSMQSQIDTTVSNVNADLTEQNQTIANLSAATTAALATKQVKHTNKTVTLLPGNWEWNGGAYQNTVTVTGLKSTDDVIIAPAPGSAVNYGSYSIICAAQTTGALVFTALAAQPSVSIEVYLMILEV